jgi:hypothetical protein
MISVPEQVCVPLLAPCAPHVAQLLKINLFISFSFKSSGSSSAFPQSSSLALNTGLAPVLEKALNHTTTYSAGGALRTDPGADNSPVPDQGPWG